MEITFSPITVDRGRKFRGFGYYVDCFETGFGITAKIWDPFAKRIVTANSNYCNDAQADESKIATDKSEYIDYVFSSTIDFCREKSADKTEDAVMSFARNVLRKHHPELKDEIEKRLGKHVDVAGIVMNTMQWAMNLKTQPVILYGRTCPGGKPYPDKKKVLIAYKSLVKKGITSNENFLLLWKMALTLHNVVQYDPISQEEYEKES